MGNVYSGDSLMHILFAENIQHHELVVLPVNIFYPLFSLGFDWTGRVTTHDE